MKAREIIPGWPRGRSTSRPCAAGLPWQYTYSLISGELLNVGNRTEWQGLGRKPYKRPLVISSRQAWRDDVERESDWCVYLAEEQRKADMMEAWHELQRISVRGAPLASSECFIAFYPLPMGLFPETIRYLDELRRAAELLTGGQG